MLDSRKALTVAGVLCASILSISVGPKVATADVVPVFKLNGPISESPSELAGLFGDGKPRTMGELLERLRQAGSDPAVPAVAFLVESPALGTAQIEELGAAMSELRERGKDVFVFAESFTMGTYLLCSAAENISVVPGGSLMLNGLNPESMYVRGLLDKIGVTPDIIHIGDYKSAGEMFTRTGPSDAANEQMARLIDDLYRQMIERVAETRELHDKKAESVLTGGPYTAEQALDKGLIDSIKYRKEFLTGIERRYGAELKTDYGGEKAFELDLSSPFALFQLFSEMLTEAKPTSGNAIAVVHVEGLIIDGKSSESGPLGRSCGSRTLRKALEKAAEDDNVKAVVLRVNSPGGSALASEIIWKGTQRVRQSKPLIVSMGNVAASGGYYVSCGADRIFADEMTLTGSIGVLSGKFVTTEMWEKIGVNWHEMPRGRHARLFSSATGFSDEERQFLTDHMLAVYSQFKERVADGRGESIRGDLEKLAGGRVYTGRQALKIGLVDEIGGLSDALAFAAKSAGLSDYRVLVLPKPRTLLDILKEAAGLEDDEIRANPMGFENAGFIRAARPLLRNMDPRRTAAVLRALGMAEILADEGVLAATPFELIIR